jgi:hypothetical protein
MQIFDYIKRRLDICSSCEHYDKEKTKCNSCGCFMPAKAALPLASCPLDKWKKESDDTN